MDIKYDLAYRIDKSIKTKQMLLKKAYNEIIVIGKELANRLSQGKKILLCGNGGSAADSQHIAAELVIRFRSSVPRKALPAVALTVDPSIMTAGSNDIGFENVFARQVEAYGNDGDVLIGISTSGNSTNVLNAFKVAKSKKMLAIGLLGCDGGRILPFCDFSVVVPSDDTALIQESHIMIGHIWCEIIEEILFPEFFRSKDA
ncbi:MAG: D-sedoheptulose-7-phosphate isomerase [Candidatus Kapaibacteriales bacterium]